MASLEKVPLPNGTAYRVSYRIGGKRKREYLPKNTPPVHARAVLAEFNKRLALHKMGTARFVSPLSNEQPGGIKLSFFIEKYLKISEGTKARKTFVKDKAVLGNLLKFTDDIFLSEIEYQTLQNYIVNRLSAVKPISVNTEIRHLKAAFTHAVKWGYLKQSPLKEVKQLKIKNEDFPKFLTKDEVRKFLESITDKDFKTLMQFYLFTGARRDEALNLTWQDIDLKRGTVHLTHTKSGKSRSVPIPDGLKEVLDGMSGTGKPFPYESDHVTKKTKRCLKAAGLDKALHLHSLRHTYASHLAMAGVDLKTLSELLGHSSTRVTEKYAHLMPDHLKAAASKISY